MDSPLRVPLTMNECPAAGGFGAVKPSGSWSRFSVNRSSGSRRSEAHRSRRSACRRTRTDWGPRLGELVWVAPGAHDQVRFGTRAEAGMWSRRRGRGRGPDLHQRSRVPALGIPDFKHPSSGRHHDALVSRELVFAGEGRPVAARSPRPPFLIGNARRGYLQSIFKPHECASAASVQRAPSRPPP